MDLTGVYALKVEQKGEVGEGPCGGWLGYAAWFHTSINEQTLTITYKRLDNPYFPN